MRVALCLSGQSRCVEPNYPNIQRAILGVAAVDVFIHTWDSIDYINQDPQAANPEKAVELYRPKLYQVEPQIKFSQHDFEYITDFQDRIGWMFQRVKSMFYSIREANRLKSDYEIAQGFRYDCVIRCRMDSICPEPFDSKIMKPGTLFVHSYPFARPPAFPEVCYGDQLAFGDSAIMDIYSAAYEHIAEGIRATKRVHAGTLLTWYLDVKQGLSSTEGCAFLDVGQDKLMR